ncbi:unnamed protein product, partial [Rotaria magnacalcarata]
QPVPVPAQQALQQLVLVLAQQAPQLQQQRRRARLLLAVLMYVATTTTVASLQSDCSALQAELTRVKLGLGIGLGSGMAITSGLAAGSYIYFTRRLAQLSSTGFIGRKEFTSFC